VVQVQPTVQVLRLSQNPALASPDNALPRFVVPALDLVQALAADGTVEAFSCPRFAARGTSTESIVELDPSYYGYALCLCAAGSFGINGACAACPNGMQCPGGARFEVPPGYFPLPSPQLPLSAQPCRDIQISQTPCNPAGLPEFTCATGYAGRLCSQCDIGYGSSGAGCTPCNIGVTVTLIVIVVLRLAMLFGRALYKPSSGSGVNRSLLFYLQTSAVLSALQPESSSQIAFFGILQFTCVRNARPRHTAASVTRAGSCCALSQARGCVQLPHTSRSRCCFSPQEPQTQWCRMPCRVLGAADAGAAAFDGAFHILLGMTAVTYVGVALWLRFRRPRAARRRASWLQDCSRALLFCFTSVYFPIVVTAVSMLPCSEDALGGQFMRAAPWVSCGSATRASLVGASSFALVVWGIGFPAGLGWYMWRHRKEDRMAGDLYGTVGCAPSCVPGLGCV
jgi:hypothetical protein